MKDNEVFIIGLGNPGKQYIKSRHNIGFLLLETFSKKYDAQFTLKNKLKSRYTEFKINDSIYKLFMPHTYMNNSGDAVKAIVDWYKISLDKVFIIVDDIDLPLGKIRFRKKGSSGGHNGLKDIINKLQTENFNRIKIGIGSPPINETKKQLNTISHVLGNISSQENSTLEKVYQKVIESLEELDIKNEDYIISELNSFHK
ncbi:Peptidyl-tRNA hydrolase [Prochlorococcus marinus str. MIT 9515]|uniref:Peptidyl-tRNA hydrolase n=1 Tax=Prochlorococcus marinus (strain MIT 9515) TaxID=167542 RepID=PTH_PROM5|nr:aminoacyl-tRNA hydrolase [Prochlorococcus marinus]A2BUN1.1 RecName: Full=Peptidyl-tRNA hydrolase; Short=PTH [Prochlorococcus marinus str. MIT 9515]ABM71492.1 Peptidyl-tRNA hydrolase [Prochlorococcus marinus str. MIT 9515]